MRVRISRQGLSVVVGGSIAALLGACGFDPSEVDPVPATCAPRVYRIEAVELPRSGTAAAQLAIDLDGDGDADNRLGRLHATLASFFSDWRPDDQLTARLADGRLDWFATVARCDGEVAIGLVAGRDDDGDGRYTLEPGGEPALGDDRLVQGGEVSLPLLGFTDPLGLGDAPGWAAGLGVAVAPRMLDDDHLEAVVGAGIHLDDAALAPVAGFLTRHLGDSVIARALDGDDDGAITVAELRDSPAIAALIEDDVDVTGADGVADHVSLGFTLRATAARTE